MNILFSNLRSTFAQHRTITTTFKRRKMFWCWSNVPDLFGVNPRFHFEISVVSVERVACDIDHPNGLHILVPNVARASQPRSIRNRPRLNGQNSRRRSMSSPESRDHHVTVFNDNSSTQALLLSDH